MNKNSRAFKIGFQIGRQLAAAAIAFTIVGTGYLIWISLFQ